MIIPFSDEQLAQLSRIPVLAPLKKAELARVLKDSREVFLETGAIVFSAGEPGDAMYVVLSGHLKAWGGGEQGGLVGEFRDGDFFGEMALVLDEPRTATVQVAADSRLLAVSQETFGRLEANPRVHAYLEEVRLARRIDTIGRNPLCSLLDPQSREELAPRFEERVCERGDVVFSVGDPADAFYLILSGELEVWGGEGGSQLIGHLGAPNSFGEQALLMNQARAATIRVAERARLLVLGCEAFERLFAAYPRVMEYLEDIREDRGLQLMEQVPLFSYLDPEERRVLRALLKDVSFEQGDVVCEAGEEGDAFYVVRSGELEVWGGAHGRELLDTIGPSGCFGEDSLVLGAPRNATVKAAGPVRLLALERHAFERFFLRKPKAVAYLNEVRQRRRAAAFNQISLFKLVDPDALEDVRDEFVELTFRKGEAVCRAGESSTTFYVVLNGALDVWSAEEPPERLARLGPGDFFGELAVILGEKRAATVVAAQRSQLLGLPKDAFTRLFLRNPRSLEYFSRVMCQRLSSTITRESVGTGELDIVVVGEPGLVGKSLVAGTLAALLREITGAPVLLLRLRGADPNERLPGLHLHLGGVAQTFEVVRGGLLEQSHGTVELTVGFEPEASADRLGGADLRARQPTGRRLQVQGVRHGRRRPRAVRRRAGVRRRAASRSSSRRSRCSRQPRAAAGRPQVVHYPVVNLRNPRSRRIADQRLRAVRDPRPAGGRSGVGARRPALAGGDAAVAAGSQDPRPQRRAWCSGGARRSASRTSECCRSWREQGPRRPRGRLQHRLDDRHQLRGRLRRRADDREGPRDGPARLPRDRPRLHALQARHHRGRASEEPLLAPPVQQGDLRGPRPPLPHRGDRHPHGRARGHRPRTARGRVPRLDRGAPDHLPGAAGRARARRRRCRRPGAGRDRSADGGRPRDRRARGSPAQEGRRDRDLEVVRPAERVQPFAFGRGEDMPNSLDITMNSLQTLQHELGVYKIISADVTIQPELSDFTWTDFDRSRELVERGARRPRPRCRRCARR